MFVFFVCIIVVLLFVFVVCVCLRVLFRGLHSNVLGVCVFCLVVVVLFLVGGFGFVC